LSSDDYDVPEIEARWLVEQRGNVQRYLDDEGVRHLGVASEPAWFVAPYVSVWTVQSIAKPGAINWWAISGDLPTDYLSSHDATDPRSALAEFAKRWREVALYMLRGEEHPAIKIGNPQNRRELGDLLMRRAQVFESWVDNAEMW
jgi:hypothetical protein